VKVVIGTVHGEEVNGWFFHSIVNLASFIRRNSHGKHTATVLDADDWALVRSGPAMALGRGKLIGTFLEQTDGDALVMLDSDMAFTPDTILAMVNAFEEIRKEHGEEAAMLGGLAFISNDPRHTHPIPNLWADNPEAPGYIRAVHEYQPNTLYEIAATGGACLIVHRDALEKITKDENGRGINPFHHVPIIDWIMLARALDQSEGTIDQKAEMLKNIVLNADQLGEDLSFCQRLRNAGFRLFLHTGLRFDHAKSTLIGEPEYFRAVQEARREYESAQVAEKEVEVV